MDALNNQVVINGTDIWNAFGAFLTEERPGGRENLTAILSPSKAKVPVGVTFREENGTKYLSTLHLKNEERDVTLHFAIFAKTRMQWLEQYRGFIQFLKQGDKGWLNICFPALDLTLRMFYLEASSFKPLTYLWKEGVQASRFKVKFREPVPSF